jgi:hypothetical protein
MQSAHISGIELGRGEANGGLIRVRVHLQHRDEDCADHPYATVSDSYVVPVELGGRISGIRESQEKSVTLWVCCP